MIESLYILIICAISCGIIGIFIILRDLSMVTDAIAHSVLLGIVLAFFITHDIDSQLLLIGASLFGVITVFSIELLAKTGYVKKQDAVGIVFPIFFALAVILITKFLRNVHIDTGIVLMGDIILAPLHRIDVFGATLPFTLVTNSIMLIINLAFIIIFYKELKLSTFDPEYTIIAGFSATFLFYLLMTLVSMTAVVAFKAVGSILVISFFITPGLSAYLITKDLKHMIVLTAILGAISSIIGYYIAIALNVSMSGMCAFVSLIIFLIVTLVHENGLITQFFKRRQNKREQLENLIIIHIGNHQDTDCESEEAGLNSMHRHLNWKKEVLDKQVKILKNKNYIKCEDNCSIIRLTEKGQEKYKMCQKDYGLI